MQHPPTPKIAIEDEFVDIIGKAMTGLRISEQELSTKSGVPLETVRMLARGGLDETSLPQVAPVLGLDANALVRSALGSWYPRPVEVEGLELFNTRYHSGMTVNSFLIFDPESNQGAIFDTGTNALPLLERVENLGLKSLDCS